MGKENPPGRVSHLLTVVALFFSTPAFAGSTPNCEPSSLAGGAASIRAIAEKADADAVCAEVEKLGISNCNTLVARGNPSCGLTPGEIAALNAYIGIGYITINSALREGSKEFNLVVDHINMALDRFPDFVGFVGRGTNLPKEVLDLHQVGSTLTYAGFTSSSTASGWDLNQKFIIFSKHGKMIMGASRYAEELEVIFKSGTRFKVLNRKLRDGTTQIVMKEIDPSMTPEEDKKEDKALLKKLKANPKPFTGNEWICPQNEALSPEQKKPIIQKLPVEVIR